MRDAAGTPVRRLASERVYLFRALWFGRGFDSPLPSFDEKICASAARAAGREP